MTSIRRNAAIVVAALTVLLALWLRYETAMHEITGAASSCSLSEIFDCDAVQASEYAKVMGVSLSTWGAAGNLILLLWLVGSRRGGATLLAAAGALATFNLLAAGYALYLSWFELETFCLYCAGMQLGSLALFVLIVPRTLPARERLRPRALAFGGFLAAGILLLALAGESYAAQRTGLLRLFAQPGGQAMRLDISDTMTLGDPSTPISVVIFFDFGCPHCNACYDKAAYLAEKYPDKVHFRFKHFPLDRSCNPELDGTAHPAACLAAAAGQAAAGLGKSEEALEYLFENRRFGFTPDILDGLGKKLGVPAERWIGLRTAAAMKKLVARDIDDGNLLDLAYVPAVFVKGRFTDANLLVETVETLK